VTGHGDRHVTTVDSCPSFTRGEARQPSSAPAFSRDKPVRAVSSRARRGVLCVLLAHLAWRAGNHTDVYMPEPRMPVGRLAEVSRHAPRTTFYPCQSIEDWAPNTAYARGVMITGPLKCPICQNGGSITRSLHGHFNQLASDVDARHVSLGYLRSMRRSTRSPATSPPVVCHPGAQDGWGVPQHVSPSG
jgi:hypothetical protein